MMNFKKTLSIIGLIALLITFIPFSQISVQATTSGDVVINEIAWMGTTTSYANEWMELYNNTATTVDLTGWTLTAADGSPSVSLSGTISPHGYYLLERTDDTSVPNSTANLIYTGNLSNSREVLELKDNTGLLIDQVDSWYAGDNTTKATMERIDPTVSGTTATNWVLSNQAYSVGFGTPKLDNSQTSLPGENLHNVSNDPGAINVYFNKSALDHYATAGNKANYNVNLENRLLERINNATTSIDMATYEINLPKIVNALMQKASQGINIRIIADAKDATDPNYIDRYKTMRLYIEEMERGLDGVVGTSDDIHVFSDSIMFAVEDQTLRPNYNLPAAPSDFPYVSTTVGATAYSGYMIADAEQKTDGTYYSPADQMHNKFVLVDGQWVWTGSWNYTVTGLYGTNTNMQNGILGGNTQNSVEINSTDLANVYETEFDEMWGSTTLTPNPALSNFHSRKTDNTLHSVNVGGKTVEVYFSAGDNAIGKMRDLIKNHADYNTYFDIFAWSDQGLVDELKYKWEGSYNDLQGTKTGFDIKGVFDGDYWNQWWSASVDMTGRTASQTSTGNPNTRWNNPAPVYSDQEDRKLHSKTMIVDVNTTSDPTVVIGSTNWSNNGNDVNDENMLFIHDANIANQFLQEFYARYSKAGGQIPQ